MSSLSTFNPYFACHLRIASYIISELSVSNSWIENAPSEEKRQQAAEIIRIFLAGRLSALQSNLVKFKRVEFSGLKIEYSAAPLLIQNSFRF
jgi:hypothetical protein